MLPLYAGYDPLQLSATTSWLSTDARQYRYTSTVNKTIEADAAYNELCHDLLGRGPERVSQGDMDAMHDEVTRVATGDSFSPDVHYVQEVGRPCQVQSRSSQQ